MYKPFEPSSIPLWWERQLGATGITYHDPTLVSRVVLPGGDDFKLAIEPGLKLRPMPEVYSPSFDGVFSNHTFQSNRGDSLIRAYEDRAPISNVDMFVPTYKTERSGFYLTKI